MRFALKMVDLKKIVYTTQKVIKIKVEFPI